MLRNRFARATPRFGRPDTGVLGTASWERLCPARMEAKRPHVAHEYLVWRTREERIDWFERADGEYRPLPRDDRGVIRSRVFPGLRIAADALLRGNLADASREVERGVGSPEHRAFAARLAARRRSRSSPGGA